MVWWVLLSLLLAAVIAPWAYQAGKSLAAAAAAGELSAFSEWLGAAAGRAKFSRFFNRCLVFSALVLLPVLLWRMRRLRAEGRAAVAPLAKVGWKSALLQVAAGLVIAGGILWGLGMVAEALGAFEPRPVPQAKKLVGKILIPSLIVPPLEEWLFRGMLLGLWLGIARPAAACVGTSLCFAFLHFLEPPGGTVIADPTSPTAGFELLSLILLHFVEPMFFVTDYAVLFSIGMILALARLRTGALWFPIGLHAGWIAAFKGFNLFFTAVDGHPLHPWGIGESLRSGLLPLLALGLTAVAGHFASRPFAVSRASR